MWSNKITRLLRRLREHFRRVADGHRRSPAASGSANTAKPPSTPDRHTIQQRVTNIRLHLHNEQLREHAKQDEDKSDQRIEREIKSVWHNWPNWPNWPNWNNWPNWPNWFNR